MTDAHPERYPHRDLTRRRPVVEPVSYGDYDYGSLRCTPVDCVRNAGEGHCDSTCEPEITVDAHRDYVNVMTCRFPIGSPVHR